jgi:serine/threonine protein kinase
MALSGFNSQPANVFLDCDNNAKLGDIGLASHNYVGSSGIQGGDGEEAIGTYGYLAPEYKGPGGGRSSNKTDTYAFGLTLLQVFAYIAAAVVLSLTTASLL